jgi:hypothetical protein
MIATRVPAQQAQQMQMQQTQGQMQQTQGPMQPTQGQMQPTQAQQAKAADPHSGTTLNATRTGAVKLSSAEAQRIVSLLDEAVAKLTGLTLAAREAMGDRCVPWLFFFIFLKGGGYFACQETGDVVKPMFPSLPKTISLSPPRLQNPNHGFLKKKKNENTTVRSGVLGAEAREALVQQTRLEREYMRRLAESTGGEGGDDDDGALDSMAADVYTGAREAARAISRDTHAMEHFERQYGVGAFFLGGVG